MTDYTNFAGGNKVVALAITPEVLTTPGSCNHVWIGAPVSATETPLNTEVVFIGDSSEQNIPILPDDYEGITIAIDNTDDIYVKVSVNGESVNYRVFSNVNASTDPIDFAGIGDRSNIKDLCAAQGLFTTIIGQGRSTAVGLGNVTINFGGTCRYVVLWLDSGSSRIHVNFDGTAASDTTPPGIEDNMNPRLVSLSVSATSIQVYASGATVINWVAGN